jgi:hypothetical protein
MRRLTLLLLGIAAAAGLLRRLRPTRFVEVQFSDGSSVRLTSEPEARDLLDDAYAILQLA